MFKPKPFKHKIFKEVFSDDQFTWLKYAIPKFDEHYLGVSRVIEQLTTNWLGMPKVTKDYQSVTMIDAPIILDYLYPYIAANEATYVEESDSYQPFPFPNMYALAMQDIILHTQSAYAKIKAANIAAGNEKANKEVDMLEQTKITSLQELVEKKWLKTACPITKDLIDIGYFPLWITFGTRTRTLTLIRQAGRTNTYKIASISEFMHRDDRKNSSFMSMNEIILTGEAASALMNDEPHAEKGNKGE